MKKLMAIIVIFVFTLSSCGVLNQGYDYTMDVISLKSESIKIEAQYQNIYDLVDNNRDAFTDEEIDELENVHYAFTEAAKLIKDIKSVDEIPTPEDLVRAYELSYIGYTTAKVIINDHKEIFTTAQWKQLEMFDIEAVKYDAQVRNLLKDPSRENINKILGIIIAVGGMTYKYILPLVVTAI